MSIAYTCRTVFLNIFYFVNVNYLKLQPISCASLSPPLFENMELQLLAELSCLLGMSSGTAPARMNLMF